MSAGVHWKKIGFYQSRDELAAQVRPTRQPFELEIVQYLEQGVDIITSLSWVRDLLDSDASQICQFSVKTDGEWIWPRTLAYYVNAYHVSLPDSFVEKMRQSDWMVGSLDGGLIEAAAAEIGVLFGVESPVDENP